MYLINNVSQIIPKIEMWYQCSCSLGASNLNPKVQPSLLRDNLTVRCSLHCCGTQIVIAAFVVAWFSSSRRALTAPTCDVWIVNNPSLEVRDNKSQNVGELRNFHSAYRLNGKN